MLSYDFMSDLIGFVPVHLPRPRSLQNASSDDAFLSVRAVFLNKLIFHEVVSVSYTHLTLPTNREV